VCQTLRKSFPPSRFCPRASPFGKGGEATDRLGLGSDMGEARALQLIVASKSPS